MAPPNPAPKPGHAPAAKAGAGAPDLDRALQAALIESRQRLRELVDRETHPGLFHAFGFNGHGFLLGPAVGAVITELIDAGKTATDISGLGIGRFRQEVLEVMVEFAREGMTMLCVTHEMGFARTVANRVIFMDRGEIIEQNTPDEFFLHPKSERTKLFLSQILHH